MITAERIRQAAEALDAITSALPANHPVVVEAAANAKDLVADLYAAADETDAQLEARAALQGEAHEH